MFRPESPRSCFGKPNFILGWIASVDSEISIIDLLGVDCRKSWEKESTQKRTNPVHKITPATSIIMPLIGISVGCNLAPLYSASAIPRISPRTRTEASTTSAGQSILQIWLKLLHLRMLGQKNLNLGRHWRRQ